MVFEDIGRVWREEPLGEIKRRKVEHLSDARGRAEQILGPVHRNGRRVFLLTGLVALPVLGWGAYNAPRPELAVPGVTLLFAWLFWLLWRWRNLRPPPPDSSRPVREAVQSEVDRLRFLEKFWGDVSWGSIAAYLIGETLAFEGFRPAGTERTLFSYAFYAFLLGIVAVIIFRNPLYAQAKVTPVREELESWLEGLKALELDDVGYPDPQGDPA